MNPIPITDRLISNPDVLDHALANLLEVFADYSLVPIPPGVSAGQVPVPSPAEASSSGYRSRRVVSNIAVLLGARSGGLLAIQFQQEAELAAFLERNPGSQHTLITEHAEGAIIWHQADTTHRLPLEGPGFRVRMSGLVQVFERNAVRRVDAFIHHAPPTRVDLEKLHWGMAEDGRLDVWLTRLRHGEFFGRTKRGRPVPRMNVWSQLLARQLRTRLAYEKREHEFYEATADGEWQILGDAELRARLREQIAAAPVAPAPLKALLTDEHLACLIRRLQTSLATRLPLAEARLRSFALEHLISERGASVTTAEIYMALVEDQRGRPLIPTTTFRRMIGRVLAEEPWRRSKSNSIPRESGQQHGYRGLRLRRLLLPEVGDSEGNGTLGIEFRGEKCTNPLIPVALVGLG